MVVDHLHTLVTEEFLRPYKLAGTTLVIDGNCVLYEIYHKNGGFLNCKLFAGFDVQIRSFLKSFRGLNVTPIIVIYGGSQDIKLKTILKRTKDDIKSAEKAIKVTHKSRLRFLLLKEIMKQVAKGMEIKCVESLIDTERDIASIAKILRCPVLSKNSDFILCGVDYIPYDCFKVGSPECNIYRLEHLSKRFTGLQARTIPILDLLLGDNSLDGSILSILKIKRVKFEKEDKKYQRICDILEWLKNHTLESAISEILNNLHLDKRLKSLKTIEKVLNKFLRVTPNMLPSLGYSKDEIGHKIEGLSIDLYRYNGPLHVSDTSPEQDNRHDFLDVTGDGTLTLIPVNEDDLCESAPAWFIEEFRAANFPSYFIDMMARQLYVCAIQLEDFSEPTCVQTSLKIIRNIFALLNAGTSDSSVLRYIARGSSNEIKIYELDCNDLLPETTIPPLKSLRSCDRKILQEIFLKTIGVSGALLDEFPPEWALYLATVKYWLKEADERYTKDCFLYSLLMTIIHSVISGQSRPVKWRNIASRRSAIDDCLAKITYEDRKVVESNFRNILPGPRPFRLEGIHAFSLFENCLKHSFHLNALLNTPYPEMNIGKLYNDFLIYKTYLHLRDVDDVTLSVERMIGESSSVVLLLKTITRKLLSFSQV